MKVRLERYGLVNCLALHSWTDETLLPDVTVACLDLDAAVEADLLLELRYNTPLQVVKRFRRSALVAPGSRSITDVDEQRTGVRRSPRRVLYDRRERCPAGGTGAGYGLRWNYTPPCVTLDWRPPCKIRGKAPFTTVVHWYADGWIIDDPRPDNKRTASYHS